MNYLECFVCIENFNTKDLRPMVLPCGHTLCLRCLTNVIRDTRKCPYNCPSSNDLSQIIESFPSNINIVQYLETVQLFCSNHKDTIARFLNLSKVEAYCNECAQELSNLIESENFKSSLENELAKYINEPISDICKQMILKCNSLSNTDKFELLKKIVSGLNRVVCDTHGDQDAVAFEFIAKKLLCPDCKNQSSGIIKSITNKSLIDDLISKIMWIQRSSPMPNPPALQTPSKLSQLSLISLITSLKSMKPEPVFALSEAICPRCFNRYNDQNLPYVFPCPGIHTICFDCLKGKKIVCPVDQNLKISIKDIEPFFSKYNQVPMCSECKLPFNLSSKIPRELPCGHLFCMRCLLTNKSKPNCFKCMKSFVEKVKCLPSNQFLIEIIKKSVVYCSRHPNHVADFVIRKTLQACCAKCKVQADPGTCAKLQNRNGSFISELIEMQGEELEELVGENSAQGILDYMRKIRGLDEDLTGRSLVPDGRVLQDKAHPTWNLNQAFIFRFFSVMPTKKQVPEFQFITKPWIIDSSHKQVETVSFRANQDIGLTGIIFGQVINAAQARIDMVKVFKGNSLSLKESEIYSSPEDSSLVFDLDPGFHYQNIALRSSVQIRADNVYSILIRVKGEGVMLGRGNPFDLKTDLWGSDGTRFEFYETEDIGDYFINGQHRLTGPILGLVYQ